ncbi:MAG: hypothetical protein CTY19_07580 [Methylomonas sp.]|nr:MAG: hypothetical protein CTY19_07580 [Methylomonas sp.]
MLGISEFQNAMQPLNQGEMFMQKHAYSKIALAFTTAFIAHSSEAALFDRGGGLIYDSDLNVTWLADANYS